MGLALGGDREAGREALVIAWEGTRESDHAQRCVIAHYLADLQASLEDEVLWDEVALAEYAHSADADLTPGLQTQHVLPADGYGDMVRGGLDRLRSRLHEATTG